MGKEFRTTRTAYINRLGAILITYYPEYKLTRYPDGIALKRDFYNIIKFQFDSDNDLTFYEKNHSWLFNKMKNSDWLNEVSTRVYKLFYEEADYSKQEQLFVKKYRWQRLLPYKWMSRFRTLIVSLCFIWLFCFNGTLMPFAEYDKIKSKISELSNVEMDNNEPNKKVLYYKVFYIEDPTYALMREGFCPVDSFENRFENRGVLYEVDKDIRFYKVMTFNTYHEIEEYDMQMMQLKYALVDAAVHRNIATWILVAYGFMIVVYIMRRPVRKA